MNPLFETIVSFVLICILFELRSVNRNLGRIAKNQEK